MVYDNDSVATVLFQCMWFLGNDQSELPLCVVSFSFHLPARKLQKWPSHVVGKFSGRNGVDELVQPSRQAVNDGLRPIVRLHCYFNDILILTAIVLWHCRHLVQLIQACGFGLDRAWGIGRRAVVYSQLQSSLHCRCSRVSLFRLWLGLTLRHVSLMHDAHCDCCLQFDRGVMRPEGIFRPVRPVAQLLVLR